MNPLDVVKAQFLMQQVRGEARDTAFLTNSKEVLVPVVHGAHFAWPASKRSVSQSEVQTPESESLGWGWGSPC